MWPRARFLRERIWVYLYHIGEAIWGEIGSHWVTFLVPIHPRKNQPLRQYCACFYHSSNIYHYLLTHLDSLKGIYGVSIGIRKEIVSFKHSVPIFQKITQCHQISPNHMIPIFAGKFGVQLPSGGQKNENFPMKMTRSYHE